MKFLSMLAMAALAVSLSAETIKYDLKLDFSNNRQSAVTEDGVLTYTGPGTLIFKPVKLNPAAKYTLTFDMKQNGTAKAFPVYGGFYCYNKTGRLITHESVYYTEASFTELAKDAKVGDRSITVKDGSMWKKDTQVAFNAKKDKSDIPNYDIAKYTTKIEKQGDVWVISLSTPLKKAYAAGTNVRQHLSGGYIYSSIVRVPTSDWKTYTGTINGKDMWVGSVTIRPIIMLNWNWQDRTGSTQIRNVSLTITK